MPFDLVIIEAAELQNFSDEITISNIDIKMTWHFTLL
jgi:hypothetical protein